MDGQQGPSDFLKHPSYHQVATFFLGFVFISCIHFTFHIPLAAARRLRLHLLGRQATPGGSGLEANRPLDDDKVRRWLGSNRSHPATTSSSFHPNTNHLALTLTLCFAMASLADFGSLLAFDQNDGLVSCAFLVAWGGMAAQSARLLGLLKLSLDLRRLGVPRWETFLYWVCLVGAVAPMFASNAIGIGVIRPLPGGRWALCYQKHFLPTAVLSSVINIVLELYSIIRIYNLIVPDFLLPRHKFDALLDVRMSRALSLLTLDLVTAVPAAHSFNVLANFIPSSLGALIVLAAFNHKSPNVRLTSTASIPGTRPESLHSRSTIEIKKMPSSRSLTNHRQRVSHPFAASALLDQSPETEDWPESASPHDPEKAYISYPEAAANPRPKLQTWRNSDQSITSESDSEVARSVKGAVVGFAFKDVVGSSRRRHDRSFLPATPENLLPTARAGVLPLSTPFRVPRPILAPQALQVEMLERASRFERDRPSSAVPSSTSLLSPPQIAITVATPGFSPSSSNSSSRPSISISVPSNVGSNGSNDSTKSSLHLTPSTPVQSQPSRRASSESDWRYDIRHDARHDSLSSQPSSGEEAPSLQLQRNSGGSGRLPPADDDLSIVYEASHEDSDSVPPSRAYRPTFGEHMFVEGGIGRPISTPVGVPEDVQEGGQSNSNGSP